MMLDVDHQTQTPPLLEVPTGHDLTQASAVLIPDGQVRKQI